MVSLTRVSPLAEVAAIQSETLLIEEVSSYGLLRLQVFSRGADNEAVLAKLLALPLPGPGKSALIEQGFIGWAAPCEWILAVPQENESEFADSLRQKLSGQLAAVTSIADSRVVLRLSGVLARQVLAMGSAVDFDPCIFNPGTCVTTKLAGVAAMILQPWEQNELLIFVDRSHGHYLWCWLEQAAVGAETTNRPPQ